MLILLTPVQHLPILEGLGPVPDLPIWEGVGPVPDLPVWEGVGLVSKALAKKIQINTKRPEMDEN